MTDTLLAFDIGTTGNKAALVEAPSGVVLEAVTVPYATRYTPDGGAEQDPLDWWDSVCAACRTLTARRPEAMGRVAAVACGGIMNGVVLVDGRGEALRPALIHADIRSAPQCRALEASVGRQAVFRATANRLDPHLSLPKLAWLAEREPEVLGRAAFAVQAKDYVAGRLTGAVGLTDPSDASLSGAFDPVSRQWVTDLWRQAGVPLRLLPTVVPATQVVGHITDEAARRTGLAAGLPVVMGGGDAACATAGAGVGLGEAYNYLGGTSWVGLRAARPLGDDRLSSFCNLDETLTAFGTVQSAGSSLEWFASAFGRGTWEGVSGEEMFPELDGLAAAVPPGARNLFFLPYLQGERAPLWDADARGVFFGLATHHGRAEMFRAVVEGVAFALRSVLDVFGESGHPLPALRLLGGGASSGLWRQILAGAFDRRLRLIADTSSATSRGAAMAAGVGVGLWPSWEAALATVRVGGEETPDPALVATYGPRYAFFQSLYPLLRERFEALARL